MKKYHLFSILLLLFISCEENVKFNSPAFQGIKENIFWKAVQSTATINADGSLTVNAYTKDEEVILKTNATTTTNYDLGKDKISTVTYTSNDPTEKTSYTTDSDNGAGQITITEYDAIKKTISGTFKFNVTKIPLGDATLHFREGVFYKVPITP